MRLKILAGLYFIGLTIVIIKAEAAPMNMHNHDAKQSGAVIMFGNSDHIELTKSSDKVPSAPTSEHEHH